MVRLGVPTRAENGTVGTEQHCMDSRNSPSPSPPAPHHCSPPCWCARLLPCCRKATLLSLQPKDELSGVLTGVTAIPPPPVNGGGDDSDD